MIPRIFSSCSAGTASSTPGGTYYACHPQIFTSSHFVQTIAAAMGRRARLLPIPPSLGRAALTLTETAARLAGKATILTTDKANEFFQAAWTGTPDPLTRDTGWRAAYGLEAGLAETCAWYRAARWI